eukprot:scaffold4412_cov71-Phaeocystis_antarctica.AAC.15
MLARALLTPALSSIGRSAVLSRHISMKAAGERGGITADERFLFDLNGFLVLRGILSPEEVAAANAAVDAKQSLLQSRDTAALRNTQTGKRPRLEPSRQWPPPADLCTCVSLTQARRSMPRGRVLTWVACSSGSSRTARSSAICSATPSSCLTSRSCAEWATASTTSRCSSHRRQRDRRMDGWMGDR